MFTWSPVRPLLLQCLLVGWLAGCTAGTPTKVWDAALPPTLLQHATTEVDHLFAPGRSSVFGDPQRVRSLWIPVQPTDTTSPFALHRAVQRLASLTHGEILDGASIVGAEVWGQHRAGMPLHYDRDEALFARSNGVEQRHPIASTVTYLRDAGAPTLILNHTTKSSAREFSRATKPAAPHDAWLIWPRVGRHVLFCGDLLHGVIAPLAPQDFGSTQSDERTTLLINWWAEELPATAGHAVRLTSSWAADAVSPRSGLRGLPALPAEFVVEFEKNLLLGGQCDGDLESSEYSTHTEGTGRCLPSPVQISVHELNVTAQYAGPESALRKISMEMPSTVPSFGSSITGSLIDNSVELTLPTIALSGRAAAVHAIEIVASAGMSLTVGTALNSTVNSPLPQLQSNETQKSLAVDQQIEAAMAAAVQQRQRQRPQRLNGGCNSGDDRAGVHCATLEHLMAGYYETWAEAHATYDADRTARDLPIGSAAEQQAEKLAGEEFRAERRLWEAEARRHVRENGLRPVLMPVPRIDAKDLPLQRFREEFALPRRPVVIEGLARTTKDQPGLLAPAMRWDLSFWRKMCGTRTVRPVQYNRTSRTWGGYTRTSSRSNHPSTATIAQPHDDSLRDDHAKIEKPITMNDFISTLELDNGDDKEYLADFGLQRGCPVVEGDKKLTSSSWRDQWKLPIYFENDFFQNASLMVSAQTTEQWAREGRASPRESWPSLFIGNAGTRTGLHVDYGSSHFWMLVIDGQKDWAIFPAQMSPFLYKDWSQPYFPVNPWALEKGVERRPLSAAVRGYRATTRPGDVIFVPGGTVHAVRYPVHENGLLSLPYECVRNTRSPTLAMSMNYVDDTNIDAAVSELRAKHRSLADHDLGRALEQVGRGFRFDISN